MGCFDSTGTGAVVGGSPVGAQNCSSVTGIGGLYSGISAGANGGVIPNVGPTNGFLVPGATAPDFVAQTDFNSPVAAAQVVPEPASFLLFGFGLLGMGGYLRNRSRKVK